MNNDFDESTLIHVSNKRSKEWGSVDDRRQRQKHGDEGTTPGSQSKDHAISASKYITPVSNRKISNGLSKDTTSSITGESALTGTTLQQVLPVTDTDPSAQHDLNSNSACTSRGRSVNEMEFGADLHKDSDTDSNEDNLDDDEMWVQKKLCLKSLSSIDELFLELVPNFSDNESTVSSVWNSKFSSKPNVRPDSMKSLMMEQKQYTENINKGVKSMRYAAKIPYPNLFLPDEFHENFFEFMEKHDAHTLCRTEKWTNVVNLMIFYLLWMTMRSWAGYEPQFPNQTNLISLRNLFKMWYCNVFSVAVDYSKQRRGRGYSYSEEEVFAIEFGMYKYPVISGTGSNNGVDFLWSAILADKELSKVLKERTRDSVIDKVTSMCKEKIWDSLGFFYFQQQKLTRKVKLMTSSVEAELNEDNTKKVKYRY